MNNKQIYKKTIGFSVRRLLWDILAWVVFIGVGVVGFAIAETTTNKGLIGLAIGLIIGAIAMYIIFRYVGYTYKAGQIAMMTEGIVKGKLPEDTIGAGKKVVKERFTTVAAYYAVTGVIKGVFSQIGGTITAAGKAIGGDTGSAVGSTISSAIQTVVAYLCDCCLGWVFYRKNEKATRATMEGAVLFFKHGKTLAKNLGRVFGIGLLSFLVIAGVFGGAAFLIMNCFPDAFAKLTAEIGESFARSGKEMPEFLSNVTVVTGICAFLVGALFWEFLHSAFVRPFVLVGVLRNYINSGIEDGAPDAKSIAELDKKSPKFKKLHEEVDAGK